jgi:hypothetical protein
LTLGAVTLPTGFTLTSPPAASVAANGGMTTFTVRLDTSIVGTKTGDVSFSTNDSDENPFNFRITGTVATGPGIIGFTLINADTDQAIDTIDDGETIDLSSLPTMNLNIRADTSAGPIESVRFGFDGNANYRVENIPPYALFSDQSGNYHAGTLSVGSHTLSATPFSADNASGTQGVALAISFTVVNGGAGSLSLAAAEADGGATAVSTGSGAAGPALGVERSARQVAVRRDVGPRFSARSDVDRHDRALAAWLALGGDERGVDETVEKALAVGEPGGTDMEDAFDAIDAALDALAVCDDLL